MRNPNSVIALFFLCFYFLGTPGNQLMAQSQEVKDLYNEAIRLMDEKKDYDKAIKKLEKAVKLAPDMLDLKYEIAYANVEKGAYATAVKLLEELVNDERSTVLFYQLLGNAYDMQGKRTEAIDAYERGLERFPKEGKLYHEIGIVKYNRGEKEKAVEIWEKGIRMDPKYGTNYMELSNYYATTSERVYAIIYAEIFLNLERTSARTQAISNRLYGYYVSAFKRTGKNSMTISLSNNVLGGEKGGGKSGTDTGKASLGFGAEFEINMMTASLGEMLSGKELDAVSYTNIRKTFLEQWFKDESKATRYHNALLDWQKEILDEGHFEAYSMWLLSAGDDKGFTKWQKKHEAEFSKFVKWFNAHTPEFDENNYFVKSQYDTK